MSDRTKLPKGTRKTPARKFPKWARHEIEDTIERLLTLLDQADGDPDAEPSLGSPIPRYAHEGDPITSQERWAEGRDAGEDEHDGREPPEDDEPTLGWTADGTGVYGSDVGEDEPSLGSTHAINQEIAWAPQPGLWGAVDLEEESTSRMVMSKNQIDQNECRDHQDEAPAQGISRDMRRSSLPGIRGGQDARFVVAIFVPHSFLRCFLRNGAGGVWFVGSCRINRRSINPCNPQGLRIDRCQYPD